LANDPTVNGVVNLYMIWTSNKAATAAGTGFNNSNAEAINIAKYTESNIPRAAESGP
jgi:hypothetical protein